MTKLIKSMTMTIMVSITWDDVMAMEDAARELERGPGARVPSSN